MLTGKAGDEHIGEYGIDDSHNYMKPTDPNASFDPRNRGGPNV